MDLFPWELHPGVVVSEVIRVCGGQVGDARTVENFIPVPYLEVIPNIRVTLHIKVTDPIWTRVCVDLGKRFRNIPEHPRRMGVSKLDPFPDNLGDRLIQVQPEFRLRREDLLILCPALNGEDDRLRIEEHIPDSLFEESAIPELVRHDIDPLCNHISNQLVLLRSPTGVIFEIGE